LLLSGLLFPVHLTDTTKLYFTGVAASRKGTENKKKKRRTMQGLCGAVYARLPAASSRKRLSGRPPRRGTNIHTADHLRHHHDSEGHGHGRKMRWPQGAPVRRLAVAGAFPGGSLRMRCTKEAQSRPAGRSEQLCTDIRGYAGPTVSTDSAPAPAILRTTV